MTPDEHAQGFRRACEIIDPEQHRDLALKVGYLIAAAAADARREAIEECARIADDCVLVGDIRGRIRALPAPEAPQP